MLTGLPLFDSARARNTDPATSHEAARNHNQSGKTARHREIVLEAVCSCPFRTAAELGQVTGLGHIETQRRLSDLCRDEVIEKGPARPCTVKGSNMTTWRVKR